MKPAIFLDRDNTIIPNDGDLGDPDQVRLFQGAGSAIASLCGLGYKIIVITNQGGVARGKYSEDDVARVHDRVAQLVMDAANGARIDAFYYCPYHPEGSVRRYTQEHPWRKPQPGMLLQAAEDHRLDLSRSWTIGDQLRDIEAGKAAGTRTILLSPVGSAPVEDAPAPQRPDYVVRNLVEAVRIVAQKRHQSDFVQDTDRPAVDVPGRGKWDAAAVARLQQTARPVANAPAKEKRAEDITPGKPDESDAPSTDEPEPAPAAPAPAAPEPPRPAVSARQPKLATPPSPPPVGGTSPKPAAPPRTSPTIETPSRQPSDDDETSASLGSSKVPAETTLRQILHELRHQRSESHAFSYTAVLAIVLQMVAAVCLLGGLWMGAGDNDLFQRWIAAALIFQGATIATLLFPR